MLIICQIDLREVGVAFELQCLRNCTLSSLLYFTQLLYQLYSQSDKEINCIYTNTTASKPCRHCNSRHNNCDTLYTLVHILYIAAGMTQYNWTWMTGWQVITTVEYLSLSSLISRGPSWLREKPRSALLDCIDDTPTSNNTASNVLSAWRNRWWMSVKRPSNGITCELHHRHRCYCCGRGLQAGNIETINNMCTQQVNYTHTHTHTDTFTHTHRDTFTHTHTNLHRYLHI